MGSKMSPMALNGLTFLTANILVKYLNLYLPLHLGFTQQLADSRYSMIVFGRSLVVKEVAKLLTTLAEISFKLVGVIESSMKKSKNIGNLDGKNMTHLAKISP